MFFAIKCYLSYYYFTLWSILIGTVATMWVWQINSIIETVRLAELVGLGGIPAIL